MPADTALAERFRALDQHLAALRPLWQFRPFAESDLPEAFPAPLRNWLNGLSDSERVELTQNEAARIDALSVFIPQTKALYALAELPRVQSKETVSRPARLSYHIPGRKWEQICAFERALAVSTQPYLEWCAGKGHLGRLLAYRHHQPVDSLELQPPLCADADRLASSMQLPQRAHCVDVLAIESAARINADHHCVALHACGKLHIHLLKLAARKKPHALSLSPCCYHLIDEPAYQPLSQRGGNSPLRLTHLELKLALQDTVTAGQREQRLRTLQLRWRLGFDQLQRFLSGVDNYLPCPSPAKGIFSRRFEDFCYWCAERKGLSLPESLDFGRFEAQGQARIPLIEKMELVRLLFRRPLEVWLALDRACFLEEQGYHVQLTTFCDYQLTPRNLLIQAVRQDQSAPWTTSRG